MTSARIQPLCREYYINIGCYDGMKIKPRSITQRNIAFKLHSYHFCLIWKSGSTGFNQAIKELKDNFKFVDSVISGKHVKSFIKFY